jgi:hypothetical protein
MASSYYFSSNGNIRRNPHAIFSLLRSRRVRSQARLSRLLQHQFYFIVARLPIFQGMTS